MEIPALTCRSAPGLRKPRRRYPKLKSHGVVDSLAKNVDAMTHFAVKPRWMLLNTLGEAANWAQEHGLDPATVPSLASFKSGLFNRTTRRRIWRTPTRVVLTDALLIRDARPADDLLAPWEINIICEFGGAAPHNHAEMIGLQRVPNVDN